MNLLLKGGATVIDPLSIDAPWTSGSPAILSALAPAPPRGPGKMRTCDGAVAVAGFIDMHVRLRGLGEWPARPPPSSESNPAIDDKSVIRFIQARARVCHGRLVDVYPVGAVSVGRKGEHLAPLAEMAAAGAVAFSDDGDPVYDAEMMHHALEYAGMYNRPIIQHTQPPPHKGGSDA